MTRIQKIVYAIPEDIFRDEVFRNLLLSDAFSALRCAGPKFLTEKEKQLLISQFAEYCKVTPEEDELEEYAYAFTQREMREFTC